MKKRGRVSWVTGPNSNRARNKNGNLNHKNVQARYLGPSFSALPKDIMMNIFSRLFIKSIPFCKSVCKAWRDLISDSEFAKLHFDETCDQVCLLIHTSVSKSRPEMLYLVQPNKDELGLKIKMRNRTKFELSCDPTSQNGYDIVNSCKGLLCLSPQIKGNSVVICNPVTREFTVLPDTEEIDFFPRIRYGFGFSHVANQYKVVRIVNTTVEIHIVGSESWREIESKPEHFMCGSLTYLKGFLYWSSSSRPHSLISFDIENERCGFVLGPELEANQLYMENVGVLGGELCMSFVTKSGSLQVWGMKESGVQRTWSKVLYVNNILSGSLLLFHSNSNSLVQVDRKKHGFRCLKISGMGSKVKTIVAHTPRLVSLQQSLSGKNVRCSNSC